jgi:AraC-like DNA-binding protein
MSPNGQAAQDVVMPSALAVDLAPSAGFEVHTHDHHQLALAARGVLVMAVEGATWVLPRSRALWIPAGIRHSVTATVETAMLSLYIDPDRCPLAWTAPTVVGAGGLLGELVIHLSRDELPADQRARAEAVLWDQMAPLPVTTLSTPLPSDERALRVADGLLADVADGRALADWGRAVGASSRTLARLFAAETGMGFERWRTNARLAAALPLLATGRSVGAVAQRVGYAAPSAFVAAFRREIGTTPAEYFRAH